MNETGTQSALQQKQVESDRLMAHTEKKVSVQEITDRYPGMENEPKALDKLGTNESSNGEDSMAKKGRRRRRRSKKRQSRESNVIQFPAQKQVVGSDIVVDTRDDSQSDSTQEKQARPQSTPPSGKKKDTNRAEPMEEPSESDSTEDVSLLADEGIDTIADDEGIETISDTGEHSAVAAEFFSAKSYEAQLEQEGWDDLETETVPLSRGDRRWRGVAIATCLLGLVVLTVFLLTTKVFSPQPIDLEDSPPPTLPELSNLSMSALPAEENSAPAEREDPATEETSEAVENTQAVQDEEIDGFAAEVEEVPEVAVAEETEEAEPEPTTEEPTIEAETIVEEAAPALGNYDELYAAARRLRGRRQIEKLREAIEVNPNGHAALTDLAWALLNRSQFQEAEQFAERASVLDPTSSKAWITLGAARQSLRNASGAREAYQACVDQGQGSYVRECRAMLR